MLNIVHECDQRQAFVTVLDPHVSTRGEAGRIVLTVLGMVAQWSAASSGSGNTRESSEPKPRARIVVASGASTGRKFG